MNTRTERGLPGEEQVWLLVEAVCHLAVARAVVTLLPFAAIRRLLVEPPDPGAPGGGNRQAAAARRISATVAAAARRPLPWASCLSRALAAHWMLARRGIGSRIRFGVRRGPQGLSSHAWLVVSGGGPPGDPADGFAPLADYPAPIRKGYERVSHLGNLAPRR